MPISLPSPIFIVSLILLTLKKSLNKLSWRIFNVFPDILFSPPFIFHLVLAVVGGVKVGLGGGGGGGGWGGEGGGIQC